MRLVPLAAECRHSTRLGARQSAEVHLGTESPTMTQPELRWEELREPEPRQVRQAVPSNFRSASRLRREPLLLSEERLQSEVKLEP